ncbi:MAG: PqqD family protein [Erythrobacter sp.]|uniref:PqqD family protein n=1 Tax=Erythrobacter sp. TaxID=1042 RepID=UPI002633910E|nr:PqqD family protein [Erythrobacter sp.]MDJ0978926.1 PqqD family protein [Erythrobacter sp.]
MLVKRNPRVLASALPDGNTALLVVETGRYVTFDETATAIWQRIEQPISFNDLIASLMAEYDVSNDVLQSDVRNALHALEDKQVLTLTE